MKATRSLRAGIAAVAVATASTACGSSQHATDAADAGAVSIVDDPHLDSPLAPYMLSWRELTLVNHVRSVRLSGCLAKDGYQLPIKTLASELVTARAQETADLSRMYGITDRQSAERDGYWPAESPRSAPVEQIPQEKLDRCVAAADRSVDRHPGHSPYGLARELLITSRSRLEEQPESRSAITRWVTCMARSGYRVTSPLNDRGDIGAELHARANREERGVLGPSTRERAMAVADIECKTSTGLVARLDAVGQALDRQAVKAHHGALVASRRRLDRVLDRIRRSRLKY